MIQDFRSAACPGALRADVCIVGAGPAGISLAAALADSPWTVCLLESGGAHTEAASQALNEGESVGPYALDPATCRLRALGGATRIWGGGCIPLSSAEMTRRDWVADDGWPIDWDELAPYYARAGRMCGIEGAAFADGNYQPHSSEAGDPPSPLDYRTSRSRTLDFGRAYRRRLRSARGVQLVLHANLLRLGGLTGEAELVQAVVERSDLAAEGHRVGNIVWFLPAPGTASLERLMASAIAAFPSTVIVGLTGESDADAPVLSVCGRLGVEVGQPPTSPPHATTVISAPDPDEEVRAALRWVLARAEEGIPLDRIGIFYPTPDPYVRALLQHLDSAGIPANGPARERLSDSVVGRTLLAALELPAQQWRRDRVMALVASAPVRNGDQPVRPGSWETISRAAGVVQGLDDWRRKLEGRLAHLAVRRAQILTESPQTADSHGAPPPADDPRLDAMLEVLNPLLRDLPDDVVTQVSEDLGRAESGASCT